MQTESVSRLFVAYSVRRAAPPGLDQTLLIQSQRVASYTKGQFLVWS